MSTTVPPPTPRLVLSGLTLNAIQAEATRAHLLHGENSMMGTRYSSGDLAVPAGGKRRGGYLGMNTRAAGVRLIRQLAGRPDEFPDARLVRGDGWLGEWGPELDWRGDGEHPEDHAAAGRYFGYSEAAVAAYGQKVALRNLDGEEQ